MHGSRFLIYVICHFAPLVLIFALSGCSIDSSNVKCHRLDAESEQIKLADDVFVKKLCDNIWLHTNMYRFEGSTRAYPSNGIVIVDEGQAVIVDTPCTDEQTRVLINWIEQDLGAMVCHVVPTHWHIDCAGGLGAAHAHGNNSIALNRTVEIMKEKGLPVPQTGFALNKTISCGRLKVELFYPGPGHTEDNIVAYVPDCKLLFGGCMVKNAGAANLGNISEADLSEWPESLRRLKRKFSKAEIVVPGHGSYGSYEIVDNTITLLETR